jgi:putative membrane protein
MRRSGRGKNRLNILIKSLILLGFASFFLKAILTGDVTLYVHPRTIPVIAFASVVMIVIAIFMLGELFAGATEKVRGRTLVIWLFPLLLAFAVPAQSLGADVAAAGEIQLSGSAALSADSSAGLSPEVPRDETNSSALPESGQQAVQEETADPFAKEDGRLLRDGVLVMDSDQFYRSMIEISDNLDQYLGVPVEVTGFVFRDVEDIKDDQFVPARMLMTCCAADLVPIGLLCSYEETGTLSENDWVRVTGTIGETEYMGKTIPCIDADSVEISQAPQDAYVYPY